MNAVNAELLGYLILSKTLLSCFLISGGIFSLFNGSFLPVLADLDFEISPQNDSSCMHDCKEEQPIINDDNPE